MSGYFLNIAIALQIVIGALITALSVVTTGKQTQIMTAVLGEDIHANLPSNLTFLQVAPQL